VNLARTRKRGSAAGDNPWGSDTLEWAEASPPRAAQFPDIPSVSDRNPLWAPAGTAEASVSALSYSPATWRGALCVSICGARPEALVHLPSTSIWPFVMSIGFVLLFSGALLDNAWLALGGAVVTASSLIGWFWPTDTERRAVAERNELPLPLGVAGRLSNGWWGTWVLVVILATALTTIIACALYIESHSGNAMPRDGTQQLLAALAASTALAAAAAAWWGGRGGVESIAARRRFGLTSAVLLDLTLLAFLWALYAYSESTHTKDLDAIGSIVFLTWLFQGIVTMLHLIWTALAAGWAWRAPLDIRGLAPAHNVAVLSLFLAVSWLVVALKLYF
jgi:hypothetical protein